MKKIILIVLMSLILQQSGTASASPPEIVINAVGDVMLAGRWSPFIKKKGYGYPFSAVAGELAGGDINIANLESPLATGGNEFTAKKFRFRGEPEVATALRTAGFNLVTLANNHTMDYGWEALAETQRHLDSTGISWIGAGENLDEARKMALYTLKGKKVAFLGYSLTQPIEFFAARNRPGTAPGYEKLITEDISSARSQADFVLVSFHWGKEATTSVQSYQRTAAHTAINAGADVVIGHHPHVLQGIERYNRGLIFYSLGNFAFASKSSTADVSALVRLKFSGSDRSAEILPLDVLYQRVGFRPKVLHGVKGEAVINKLNELSTPFKTGIESRNGVFVIVF